MLNLTATNQNVSPSEARFFMLISLNADERT